MGHFLDECLPRTTPGRKKNLADRTQMAGTRSRQIEKVDKGNWRKKQKSRVLDERGKKTPRCEIKLKHSARRRLGRGLAPGKEKTN